MSHSTSSQGSEQPSIAILDDYTGISQQYFTPVPSLHVSSFPETLNPSRASDAERLVTQLKPYSIISTMRERTPMPSSLLSQLPNLKLLLTTGVRNASIDLNECKQRGIVVAGTTGTRPKTYDSDGHPIHDNDQSTASTAPPPGYDSTTQHAWSLLLSLTSRIAIDNAALQRKNASSSSSWQSGLTVPLGGKTLGVVGLGKLGTNFARIAVLGFGMRVIAWSSSLDQSKADAAAVKAGVPEGAFKAVSKEELFATADVVSLHYVLSERSRNVIGAAELGAMKKSAILVNTSRGPLIDEEALLEVLGKGGIRGAALDVYWEEPLSENSLWRTTEWGADGRSEVVLSPHMGYVNEGTMHAWYAEQADDVGRFLRGEEVKTRLA